MNGLMNLSINQTMRGGSFWNSLHPGVFFAYLLLVVAAAVLASHPVLLFILLASVLAALASAGSLSAWLSSVKLFLGMVLVLVVVNTLVNPGGETVLLSGPMVAGLERITVTWENIIFSLVMGVRLLVVYSAFILFNRTMDQDRVLAFFSRLFPRSAIMVAMSARTIPVLSWRLRRTFETQQIRGVPLNSGGFFAKIKNRLPLVKVLVLSALEDSFNMGESIQARAYGSGPRTGYRREAPEPKDFLLAGVMMAALAVLFYVFIMGWGGMQFFPSLEMQSLNLVQAITFLMLAGLLILPALLSWGWHKWDYLRWKI